MALTEASIIDAITVLQTGVIEVRQANIVLKDDIEISKVYHRHTLAPGQDISDESEKVKAICNAIWTGEVIAAWDAKIQQSLPTPSAAAPRG